LQNYDIFPLYFVLIVATDSDYTEHVGRQPKTSSYLFDQILPDHFPRVIYVKPLIFCENPT